MARTCLRSIIFVPILLIGCGGFEASTLSETGMERCRSNGSLLAGRHPERMALHGSSLYVMDGYSGVTRFHRKSYGCDWELDAFWNSGGSLQFDGFLQELDVDGTGQLSAKDGGTVYFPGKDTCGTATGGYAVFPSSDGFVVPSSLGLRIYSHSAGRCIQQGGNLGIGEVLAADVDNGGIVSVESVGGNEPERLVAYSLNGNSDWARPLSLQEATEPYLCAADRVRTSSTEIAILDRTCGRVAVFDRQGLWLATILLDRIGVLRSRVRDLALPELGVAELLLDDAELTVRISWRALLGNSSDGVIGSSEF